MMKKTNANLTLCSMIFVVSLVISNVVTAKTIDLGFTFFGAPATIPGAAVCYAITFLMTDVIGELWGKKASDQTVLFGAVGQIFATLLIIFTQALPAANKDMQIAYNTLLGQNYIFVIGSLVAYFVSQFWDVWIFHKIRRWHLSRANGSIKNRWIWNNLSTMTSQIWDTVLFIGIAFGLGFGWLFDPAMRPTLFTMMACQYLFKFALAALDTPFFYILTRRQETT